MKAIWSDPLTIIGEEKLNLLILGSIFDNNKQSIAQKKANTQFTPQTINDTRVQENNPPRREEIKLDSTDWIRLSDSREPEGFGRLRFRFKLNRICSDSSSMGIVNKSFKCSTLVLKVPRFRMISVALLPLWIYFCDQSPHNAWIYYTVCGTTCLAIATIKKSLMCRE